MPGVFSDKIIDFTNEPSMWRFFVKNTFVNDNDMQLVTDIFDRNTYCTVSGGKFVHGFSFLRNWSMQLCLIDLLTPNGSNL